jgi:DNA-binding NarL/FixJ family response regulator
LIALGETGLATTLVDQLEERGRALDRPWALATGARCRGLLLSAAGKQDDALLALESALEADGRLSQPFEHGRTLLVRGAVGRRARQKRGAREPLQEALSIFESLGAPLWAAKARAELARIGGRSASALALTPTEQRVAELIATGSTNREVADALFLSVKTVEANLSRIYRKLGIASRRQLARLVNREPG